MRSLIRAAAPLAALLLLAACQVTGAAEPSGQVKGGNVQIGAPGSNAP